MLLRCPQCGRQLEVPADWGPRPFCSARCKQADLHGWLTEAYVLSTPVEPGMSDLDEEPERVPTGHA